MKTLTEYILEQSYDSEYTVTKEILKKLKKTFGAKFVGAEFTAVDGKWKGNTVVVKSYTGANKTFSVYNKDLDFKSDLKEKDFFNLLYKAGDAPTVIKFAQPTKIHESKSFSQSKGYFYGWAKRIMICRDDLVDGLGISYEEAENITDAQMEELVKTITKELKKYAPFDNGTMKVPADKAFTLYFKGTFGDPDKAWLEEEVDNVWWKEIENAMVKLDILVNESKKNITESLNSGVDIIIDKLNNSKYNNCIYDDEELNIKYNMKRLDITVSSSEPKCLHVVARPVSKLSKNLSGYNQLVKDLKEVGDTLGFIVCLEEQKMPKVQADICKRYGFIHQHGRKIRYELPTLTEYYYDPRN